ncbi:MAG: Flp pilus assembly protein CpaB [Thermoguttaceae bacterium]|nr:Flp pilus assembly protein CpaB [Thermoguttaceae bacterium]MBR4103675.1 Flp pilus assembly protein CpaB [Thermoguttaceae bacterium]
MNLKTWLLLLVALLTGGAAALGVKSIFFVEEEPAVEVADSGETTPILVANVDLPVGSELTAQNVRLTLASEKEIPREPTLTFSDAVGEITTRDLKAGEPISLFDVAVAEETAAPETSYIKPGYSIVPIEIQTATKAGGGRDFLKSTKLEKILKPGDVVDLAVVKEDKSATAAPGIAHPRRRLITETIVAGVEVFSVSDATRFSQETGDAERASTVCIQLSEEQLTAATKAAEQGRVKLVVRDEETELGVADASAPLAIDGNLGDAFEPSMNADFSFPGLTEATPAARETSVDASAPFEIAVDPEKPAAAPTDASSENASAPFEIAVDPEEPAAAPTDALPEDALAPFEIAVDPEEPAVAPTEEKNDAALFRLRDASAETPNKNDAETVEEPTEEEAEAEKTDAPSEESRQTTAAPTTAASPYRSSSVATSVADEANVEKASSAPVKKFQYVSPFVTVNKKETRRSPIVATQD